MDKSLHLEIITPDRLVLNEDVQYVGAPGVEGEFGVLPDHIPLLSALAIGVINYKAHGKTHLVFISGGFAEVSHNAVTILAESAEIADSIDANRAAEAKKRAEQRLQELKDGTDFARAHAALTRANVRLQVTGLR